MRPFLAVWTPSRPGSWLSSVFPSLYSCQYHNYTGLSQLPARRAEDHLFASARNSLRPGQREGTSLEEWCLIEGRLRILSGLSEPAHESLEASRSAGCTHFRLILSVGSCAHASSCLPSSSLSALFLSPTLCSLASFPCPYSSHQLPFHSLLTLPSDSRHYKAGPFLIRCPGKA